MLKFQELLRKNKGYNDPTIDMVIQSFGYGNEVSLRLSGKIGERGSALAGVKKVKEMDKIDEQELDNEESLINSEDLRSSKMGS